MKVALYLQYTAGDEIEASVQLALEKARAAGADLFVFPEHAASRFDDELEGLDILNEADYETIVGFVAEMCEESGCPILFSRCDCDGAIYSVYVNPWAEGEETESKYYLKHVATECSLFDVVDYQDYFDTIYEPIVLGDFTFGQTICYDATLPMVSRMYGLQGVDFIINQTGGHVDRKKWTYHMRGRALENQCSVLSTMAFYEEGKTNSYIFAFDGTGDALAAPIISDNGQARRGPDNLPDGVYLIDVPKAQRGELLSARYSTDPFFNQEPSSNKYGHLTVDLNRLQERLSGIPEVSTGVRVLRHGEHHVVFVLLTADEVLFPEVVTTRLYSHYLAQIPDKRYVLVNQWSSLSRSAYEGLVASILRERAAESYCAAILIAPTIQECIQVGANKNIQRVAIRNGNVDIDLDRTTGPESYWRTKATPLTKARWRKGYEALIAYATDRWKF